jgi:hypothetical protein
MMPGICPHERAVANILRSSGGAGITDPALRSHMTKCPRCSGLMLVVQTLCQARNETVESAPIPPPGLLWWRAQIRRRSGAVELAGRPIALVEKLALVILAAGFFCLAAWQWDQITGWAIPAASMAEALRVPFAASGGWTWALAIAGLATLALFGGMAIYLLVEGE